MKKIISLVMVVILTVITSTSALALGESDNSSGENVVILLEDNLNRELSAKYSKKEIEPYSSYASMDSESGISMQINVNDLYAEITGSIDFDDGIHSFTANGSLEKTNISSGEEGYIGVLSGKLDNGIEISLAVHTIPALSHNFVNVTIGTFTESDMNVYQPSIFVYGDYFEGMNELVDYYKSIHEFYSDSPEVSHVITQNSSIANSFSTLADNESDYYTTLRSMTVGVNRVALTDEYVQLISTCIYAPIAIKPSMLYEAYVKVNGHVGNALYFARKVFYGVISVYAENGECTISSPDNYLEQDNPYPESSSFSVDFEIPYMKWMPSVLEYVFAVLPMSVSIPIYGVKVTQSNNTNSSRVNSTKWWYRHGENISWVDGDPTTTQGGYAGKVRMTYINHAGMPDDVTINATGSITYSYESRDGLNSSIGTFTVSVDTSTSVRCD